MNTPNSLIERKMEEFEVFMDKRNLFTSEIESAERHGYVNSKSIARGFFQQALQNSKKEAYEDLEREIRKEWRPKAPIKRYERITEEELRFRHNGLLNLILQIIKTKKDE